MRTPKDVYSDMFGIGSYARHPESEPRYVFAMSALREINPRSVAEVGCGRGVFRKMVMSAFPDVEYTCYDVGNFMAGDIPVTCVDLEDRQSRIAAFVHPGSGFRKDVLVATDVLEHLDESAIDGLLCDLFHEAPSLVLTIAHHAETYGDDVLHKIVESPDWWRDRLTSMRRWKIVREEPVFVCQASGVLSTGYVLADASL